MASKDVVDFMSKYASDASVRNEWAAAKTPADQQAVLAKHAPGLSKDEQSLLMRSDAHEIRTHLKDAYAASLSIQFP